MSKSLALTTDSYLLITKLKTRGTSPAMSVVIVSEIWEVSGDKAILLILVFYTILTSLDISKERS